MAKSMFRAPSRPDGITFLLRGGPGSGKTCFALGLSRLSRRPLAVIGSDLKAGLYGKEDDFGELVNVTADSVADLDRILLELETRRNAFGGIVIDTVTEWWNLEQRAHEVVREGVTVVPMRAWRQIRDCHEARVRRLQALGLHLILVCRDRPIYERGGEELLEVGTREDTDRRDAYSADIVLRFYSKENRRFAEVLKDRTGRFDLGAVVENPTIELWLDPISSAAAPAFSTKRSPASHPMEPLALELIDHLGEIQTAEHWSRWRRKHARTLASVFQQLPDCHTKRKLERMGRAKKAEFESPAAPRRRRAAAGAI